MVRKTTPENTTFENNIDIYGRIEYIDQSLRSTENRLRAVENRLSIKTIEPDPEPSIMYVEDNKNAKGTRLDEMKKNFDEIDRRLIDLERIAVKMANENKITIGKVKVPIEFSGLAATTVLFVTGYLIYNDRWNIIRSPYYPIAIGLLFAAVVIGKFIISNRKTLPDNF